LQLPVSCNPLETLFKWRGGDTVDAECRILAPAGRFKRGVVEVEVGDGGSNLIFYTQDRYSLKKRDGKVYVTVMVSPNNAGDESEPAIIGIDCLIDKRIRSRVPKSWLMEKKLLGPGRLDPFSDT